MRCGGELVGALGVGNKDGRVPLSSEDEALLTAVIAQASLAYENARLYGALAERLEEIRTLQEYQESVIRSSSSGIVVLDAEERIHSANPAFAILLERPEEELVGLRLSDVLPGIVLGSPPQDGGEWRLQTRLSTPHGEERDLQLSASAFRDAPDRRVVVIEDMTDRIRAERALAERERLASLGVLAAGVAHEVNTPIAGLSSYAQLLLSETSPGDPRYSILKKMERQTFRAAHLVNNLLEFARPRVRTPQKTDLRAVLANAAESVETALAGRELELQTGDSEPAFVIGDPRELEQVFVNLLTNARDASPEGGVVTCRMERNGESVLVTVSDRGPGLTATAAMKIFQPFYTTKKSGGTGLGLAISRDIVRRHGGEIFLAWPRRRRRGGARRAAPGPVRIPFMRVLVVDDEEVIRDVLGTLLTREGYEVAAAASAAEATAMFDAEPYDVVLLDLMLPDRPGLDVLRQILQRDPDAVVVIVTAYSSIEGAIEAMRQGAFHYIPKPFQNEEVLLTLRKGSEARRLTEENRRLRGGALAEIRSGPHRRQVGMGCGRCSSSSAWPDPRARRSSSRARAARARSSSRAPSTPTRRDPAPRS